MSSLDDAIAALRSRIRVLESSAIDNNTSAEDARLAQRKANRKRLKLAELLRQRHATQGDPGATGDKSEAGIRDGRIASSAKVSQERQPTTNQIIALVVCSIVAITAGWWVIPAIGVCWLLDRKGKSIAGAVAVALAVLVLGFAGLKWWFGKEEAARRALKVANENAPTADSSSTIRSSAARRPVRRYRPRAF